MTTKPTPDSVTPHGRMPRHAARGRDDTTHDPYATRGKLEDNTQCPTCGAFVGKGRWQWGPAPGGGRHETCPACRRIRDGFPAGRLALHGPYVEAHADELLQLCRHQAKLESAEHAMHRIMHIDAKPGAIEITTTDVHLPRRIGEALKRAYDGELTLHFGTDACEIDVRWQRSIAPNRCSALSPRFEVAPPR